MVSQDERSSRPLNGDNETSPSDDLGGLVDDLFEAPVTASPQKKQYKPRGMFLGNRRDTGAPIDIAPQVLARHGAMLGSTGSGKR